MTVSRPELIDVGEHECVTCSRCACTFAKVHPACPRCSEEAALVARLETTELENARLREGLTAAVSGIASAKEVIRENGAASDPRLARVNEYRSIALAAAASVERGT